MNRRWAWGLVGVSLLLSGCGGSDADVEPTDFDGLWAAQRFHGDSSCSGPYDTAMPAFTMRLRAGGRGDLQYVSLDPTDLTKETCVQDFSIDGDTATMTGAQSCTYEQTTFDSTGEAIVGEVVQTYTEDQLVLSGDSIHETGVSESDSKDGPCRDTFEIDFARIE